MGISNSLRDADRKIIPMKIPAIKGIIKRRILLNYRVDPELVQNILPENFRPKLVDGYAIAGVCLIRMEAIRPKGLPSLFGLSSENSAHRIAAYWDGNDEEAVEGVFVPRRDTNSWLNVLTGGRVFPGVQHMSQFKVNDLDGEISLRVEAKDLDDPLVDLECSESDHFPKNSIFNSLEESSKFFESGCIGYSSRPNSCALDGLLLKVNHWQVSALSVESVHSAYFDDHALFPPDSITFDHALLMRDIHHEWHSEPMIEVK